MAVREGEEGTGDQGEAGDGEAVALEELDGARLFEVPQAHIAVPRRREDVVGTWSCSC